MEWPGGREGEREAACSCLTLRGSGLSIGRHLEEDEAGLGELASPWARMERGPTACPWSSAGPVTPEKNSQPSGAAPAHSDSFPEADQHQPPAPALVQSSQLPCLGPGRGLQKVGEPAFGPRTGCLQGLHCPLTRPPPRCHHHHHPSISGPLLIVLVWGNGQGCRGYRQLRDS